MGQNQRILRNRVGVALILTQRNATCNKSRIGPRVLVLSTDTVRSRGGLVCGDVSNVIIVIAWLSRGYWLIAWQVG